MGQTLGLRTFAAAKVRARARSNRGRVVSIMAVLLFCLCSKAESWVSWLSYGVDCGVRQILEYRSCFMAFSVRDGWIVISMAVLYSRFNYSKVVIIVAVLHHKVVASLRLD